MSDRHHHHSIDVSQGDRRVGWAIAVNLILTLAQLIGGLLAGSLALIADALHNFSDVIALVFALAARRIARRHADAKMTFGYARVELVAALVNYTTLIILGLYLAYEAVLRILAPEPVNGGVVVWLALGALAVNSATALLTFAMARQSVNMRAAFLHNLADALASIAVLLAGLFIVLFGWALADPLITVGISAYILWQSAREIGPVIRILILGSPPEIDTEHVLSVMLGTKGVAGVHHAHFWQIDEHQAAIEAHVVIENGAWTDADAIKKTVKNRLQKDFAIGHATLELECAQHACADQTVFAGH